MIKGKYKRMMIFFLVCTCCNPFFNDRREKNNQYCLSLIMTVVMIETYHYIFTNTFIQENRRWWECVRLFFLMLITQSRQTTRCELKDKLYNKLILLNYSVFLKTIRTDNGMYAGKNFEGKFFSFLIWHFYFVKGILPFSKFKCADHH